MAQAARTVLVTGATGGIGQQVCRRLAVAGDTLILVARHGDTLAEMAATLPSPASSHGHSWIAADMASDPSVAGFTEELARRGATLDGAVIMPPQPHATADALPPDEVWHRLFQASFVGPLSVLRAAVAAMRADPPAGRRCKVVIVSGISSVQVLGHYATANVIRAAWLAEAKTLAFALGARGIHVNTLSLGGTLSPWYVGGLERRATNSGRTFAEQISEETSNVPLGKYGTPEEVAIAIETLLGPFSDHMTGTNILHDGGFTRAY